MEYFAEDVRTTFIKSQKIFETLRSLFEASNQALEIEVLSNSSERCEEVLEILGSDIENTPLDIHHES